MELLQLQGHRRRRRRYSRLSFLSSMYAPPVNFLLSHAVFNESETREREIRKILNGGATVYFRFDVDYSLLRIFILFRLIAFPLYLSREGYYVRLTVRKPPS